MLQRPLVFISLILATALSIGLALAYFTSKQTGAYQQTDTANWESEINPQFAAYISHYSGGMRSRYSPISIRLADPVADSSNIGKEIPESWFEISPKVAGKATFADPQTIVFQPEEPLAFGMKYQVSLNTDAIFDIDDAALKSFEFPVFTPKGGFTLTPQSWKSESATNYSKQQLIIKLNVTDKITIKEVTEALTATQDGRKLSFSLEPQKNPCQTLLIISDVERKDEQGQIDISIDGKALGLDGENDTHITVPALNEAKLYSWSRDYNSSLIHLYYTDPVRKQDTVRKIQSNYYDIVGQTITGNEVVLDLSIHVPYDVKEILLQVSELFSNTIGKPLKSSEALRVSVNNSSNDIGPELSFKTSGTINPESEHKLIQFQARGLKSVTLALVPIKTQNLLETGIKLSDYNRLGNGIYYVMESARPTFKRKIYLNAGQKIDLQHLQTYQLDLQKYIGDNAGSLWTVHLVYNEEDVYDDRPEKLNAVLANSLPSQQEVFAWYDPSISADMDITKSSYYEGNTSFIDMPVREAKQLVLFTDLALIAKKSAYDHWHFFTLDIKDGSIKPNTEIELYNLQKMPIAKLVSNDQGYAEYVGSQAPQFMVAKNSSGYSFMDFRTRDDNRNALNMSNYDITGGYNGRPGAFIYSERDLYRPGDSIFLSVIFPAETEETSITKKLPAVVSIADPSGNTIYTHAIARNNKSIHTLRVPMSVTSITGKYEANCTIGQLKSQVDFSLETIKPNRMDVNLKLPTHTVIGKVVVPSPLSGRWLYGADASLLDASVEASIDVANLPLPKYLNYTFKNSVRSAKKDPEVIFKGKLNEKGSTTASLDFAKLQLNEPRSLKLSARIYEESGDYSTEVSLVDYYPYTTLPGICIKDINANNIYSYDGNEPLSIKLVNLDVNTKKPSVSPTNFKIDIYENNEDEWVDNQGYGDNYVNETSNNLVYSTKKSTSAGISTFVVNPLKELKFGGYYKKYIIEITDENNYVLSHKFSLNDYESTRDEDFEGDNNQTGQKAAEVLSVISTNKPSYQVGETASVTFNAPETGTAIFTVERDRQVLTYSSYSCIKGSNTIKLPLTEEMAPNAYIMLHLVYPYEKLGNLLTNYNYGMVPIQVNNKASHLEPIIKAPEKAYLGTPVAIAVSEKSGLEMEYTLAIVDEGLLNMTRFKTPEPFDYFYAKHPLNVSTIVNLDWLSGKDKGAIELPLAPGGDGYLSSADMAALNVRFKSFVRFLGPFKLKKGETAQHDIASDEFAGTVRVMVVAANKRNYGKAEAKVTFSSDLLVQGNAPRVLSPDDVASIPANLINLGKLKNAQVSISVEGPATVNGAKTASVTFSNTGRGLTEFTLKAAKTTGQIKLKLTAQSGKFTHYWKAIIPVRYANPSTTESKLVELAAGKSQTITLQPFGLPYTNTTALEVSSLPQISLAKHTEYLIGYPYGCMEQTISSGFGQAILTRMTTLSPVQNAAALVNVEKALDKLNNNSKESNQYQVPYWPGNSENDALITAYGNLFRNYIFGKKVLTDIKPETQSKYAEVPERINMKLVSNQQAMALTKLAKSFYPRANDWYYYNLDTRINQIIDAPAIDNTTALLIAAAIASENPSKAVGLINKLNSYKEGTSWLSSSMTHDALILLACTRLRDKQVHNYARQVAANIQSSPYYSTISLSMSLIAMEQYNEAYNNIGFASLMANVGGVKENISLQNGIELRQLKTDKPTTYELKNTGTKPLFISLSNKGIPARSVEKSSQSNLHLDIKYVDENGAPINPTNVATGTSLVAVVKINALSNLSAYDNLALNFMLPSGWEAVNRRIEGGDDSSIRTDQRDDRVLYFFSLANGQTREIRIPLKAVYSGQYYLPAVKCEHMYQPRSVYAIQAGMPVNVVKGKAL